MKIEKLEDAIGLIGDDLVEEAGRKIIKKNRFKWWLPLTAACLIIAISAGIILLPKSDVNITDVGNTTSTPDKNNSDKPINLSKHSIIEAVYPETCAYPLYDESTNDYSDFQKQLNEWQASRDSTQKGYNSSMNIDSFFKSSLKIFLNASDGKNKVYSPINIYMALGMLAELTDGNSRKQILNALGEKDIKTLRTNANALWRANYYDDGRVTSILSSSLWLNDKVNFKENTLKTIADTYYSSSYKGEMGNEAFNSALRDWLNKETKNLLGDAVKDVKMYPETVLALATSIYYKAAWSDEFNPNLTKKDTFHSKNGNIECDFMNKSSTGSLFIGENFTAYKMHLDGSGSMYLFKPNENATTNDVINNPQTAELIKRGDLWENRKSGLINLSVPKFDICATTKLYEPLSELGISDVFKMGIADFSPTTDDTDMFVSSGIHSARVKIDEKGCIGAAITVFNTCGSSMPTETFDFKLDKPFLFVVTSATADPLFAGVVNMPN